MRTSFAVLVMAVLMTGCGKNIADPNNPPFVNPPRSIQALALDSGSVGLQWFSPTGIPDSVIRRFVVKYNGITDSVAGNTHAYTANFLPRGNTTFALLTFLRSGVTSQPVAFQWAPAVRFETPPVVIYEDVGPATPRPVGIHLGSQTTNPYPVVVEAGVQPILHLVLNGGGGQQLKLQSATFAIQNGLLTLFSQTSHSASSLNYYLPAYPSTYTEDEMPLVDNTIYYVRFRGDAGESNCARIHVHILVGSGFPDRSVEIRVSLQRAPDVTFAYGGEVLQGEGLALVLPMMWRGSAPLY
jgi:hypothetical protein